MTREDIQALLAAATPGEWKHLDGFEDRPASVWYMAHGDEPDDSDLIADDMADGDARLLAAAPAALRWLLDEIARLEADLSAQLSMLCARLGGTVEGHPTASHNYLQRVDELVAIETGPLPPTAAEWQRAEAQFDAEARIAELERERDSYKLAWEREREHAGYNASLDDERETLRRERDEARDTIELLRTTAVVMDANSSAARIMELEYRAHGLEAERDEARMMLDAFEQAGIRTNDAAKEHFARIRALEAALLPFLRNAIQQHGLLWSTTVMNTEMDAARALVEPK